MVVKRRKEISEKLKRKIGEVMRWKDGRIGFDSEKHFGLGGDKGNSPLERMVEWEEIEKEMDERSK